MVASHIHDLIEEKARFDGPYAIAFALLKLARAHEDCAAALWKLGFANAATPMGALEAHGAHMGEKIDALCSSLDGMGEVVADAILHHAGVKEDA